MFSRFIILTCFLLLNLGTASLLSLSQAKPLIKIAVLDTGVQYRHASFHDIKNTSTFHHIFTNPDEDCQLFASSSLHHDHHSKHRSLPCLDGEGHGTFVSGILVGNNHCSSTTASTKNNNNNNNNNNNDYYVGVARDVASLLVAKVFSDDSSSRTSDIVDAMNFVLTRKSLENTLDDLFVGLDDNENENDDHDNEHEEEEQRITLMSLSTGSSDFLDEPFNAKIDELVSSGITIVVAAGNSHMKQGFTRVMNPADRLGVIAVGGIKGSFHEENKNPTSQIQQLATGTSYGLTHRSKLTKPDVVATSENIVGSLVFGSCGRRSGTSLSAPIVTGVLAKAHDILLRKRKGGKEKKITIRPTPGLSSVLIWKSSSLIYRLVDHDSSTTNKNTILSSSSRTSAILEDFHRKVSNSFLGVGAGALNENKLLDLAESFCEKESSSSSSSNRVAFFPPHLDFVDSTQHFPLNELKMPLMPNSVEPFEITIACADGLSTKIGKGELFFYGKITVVIDDGKGERGERDLNPEQDGLKVFVGDFDENGVLQVSSWFTTFSIGFEALESNNAHQNFRQLNTKGFIHFHYLSQESKVFVEDIKLPFHISHYSSSDIDIRKILWIATKNQIWPEHFPASDEFDPYFGCYASSSVDNNNNEHEHENHCKNKRESTEIRQAYRHHADVYEQSNDDPVGGSPVTFVMYHFMKQLKLKKERKERIHFDILQNEDLSEMKLSDTEFLSQYDVIVIFDPEEAFSKNEIEAIKQSGSSLVVIADWYQEDIIQHFRKQNPDRHTPPQQQKISSSSSFFLDKFTSGGSHLPSINKIIQPLFGVSLSTEFVYSSGDSKFNNDDDDDFEHHHDGNQDDERRRELFIGDVEIGDIAGASMVKVDDKHKMMMNNKNNIRLFGPRLCCDKNDADGESSILVLDRKLNSFVRTKLVKYRREDRLVPDSEEISVNEREEGNSIFPMIALVDDFNNNNEVADASREKRRLAVMSDTSCLFRSEQHQHPTKSASTLTPCVDLVVALFRFVLDGEVDHHRVFRGEFELDLKDVVKMQQHLFE